MEFLLKWKTPVSLILFNLISPRTALLNNKFYSLIDVAGWPDMLRRSLCLFLCSCWTQEERRSTPQTKIWVHESQRSQVLLHDLNLTFSKWLWWSHINLIPSLIVILGYFGRRRNHWMDARYLFLLTVYCISFVSLKYNTYISVSNCPSSPLALSAVTMMTTMTMIGRRLVVVVVVISLVFILHLLWNILLHYN